MEYDYIEHDAYMILDRILVPLIPVYHPCSQSGALNYYFDADATGGMVVPPVTLISRLEHIQHRLLQRSNPQLAAHLHTLGVEPHMYLVRWVRVLFAREIRMPLLLLVWDSIFATTPADFQFIDSFCVALLVEPSVCIRLMRSSDVTDALCVIQDLPTFNEKHVAALTKRAENIHMEQKVSTMMIHAQLGKQNIEAAAAEMDISNEVTMPVANGAPMDEFDRPTLELQRSDSNGSDWLKIDTFDSDVRIDCKVLVFH
jgi:hypothetical protein